MTPTDIRTGRAAGAELRRVLREFRRCAPEVAVLLVYDRPQRVQSRPGLARAFFAERCVSDSQLDDMVSALRAIGCYVQLFEGEVPFIRALADGSIEVIPRPTKIVYNGIEGGVSIGGFQPGRKALIPAVSDAFGITVCNSNAYGCAVGRHKHHYLTLLRESGLPVPRSWHYRPGHGWAAGRKPPTNTRVIVKSTFESWSVGVTEDSVFTIDETCDDRVVAISEQIGQPVCVQEFVAGVEVCVPMYICSAHCVTPPVEVILDKAPGDPEAVMTIFDNLEEEGVRYRPYEDNESTDTPLSPIARAAFETLELGSFARFDFRVDGAGNPSIIDVGVSPGVGRSSSAFASAAALGFDYEEFVQLVFAVNLAQPDPTSS